MSVPYDLYETPSPEGNDGAPSLHARVVSIGTVGSDDLARDIEFSSSLTASDVHAVLTVLSHYVGEHLSHGKRVYIEGLGYFGITATCPTVTTSKGVRSEVVKFKSVTFLPEKKLKKKLSAISFERTKRKNHSLPLTPLEVDNLLTEHFINHPQITRAEFERLCGITRNMAIRRINQLLEEGKLRKIGLDRFPAYVPARGYCTKQ